MTHPGNLLSQELNLTKRAERPHRGEHFFLCLMADYRQLLAEDQMERVAPRR